MNHDPLQTLHSLGQQVWLDDLGRTIFNDGRFEDLIGRGEISGATSNPKILADAMKDNPLYDESIQIHTELGRQEEQILLALAIEDVTQAADLLRSVYEKSNGESGFVSIEVSPFLAHDASATVTHALTLSQRVNRPNVFVKIPATDEGLVAITEATSLGCSVNVTLLFGLDRHGAVMEAYAEGLRRRLATGKPIEGIRSVASFFLSRIDALVDAQLRRVAAQDRNSEKLAQSLHGKTAIALARLASRNAAEFFGGEAFAGLRKAGAHPQRLLWASTGVKTDAYPETMYVDALVEKGTVTTLPWKTLEAYRDRGNPRLQAPHVEDAVDHVEHIESIGIRLREMRRQLEDEGVEKFIAPYVEALDAVKARQFAAVHRA